MRLTTFAFSICTALAAFTTFAHSAKPPHIVALFYEGCEKTCEGFKRGMAEEKMALDIEILDLKQDKKAVGEAVAKIQATKPDLVLSYGTTATLLTLGTMEQLNDPKFIHDLPVVFTAVADPVGSKIVQSLEKQGRANVTGTYNRVPEQINLQVIRQYDPAFKKLGLLYNSNEKNSVLKMQELTALAPKMGVELLAIDVDPGNENAPSPDLIPVRMKELAAAGVRWVYLGSSSFLNVNGELYTSSAVDNGIAVVSPYPALVKEHKALLSIAAPREEVGASAANLVLRVLRDGVNPGDLPISISTHFTYTVNMDVAKRLNLNPPENFSKETEFYRTSLQ